MQAKLFHLYALSALHCGTGQSAGVVDLPIARARATQLPIVPGSSLRGVLREHTTNYDPNIAETLFGPKKIKSDKAAFAGALAIGDAHLLVLPVRCLAGIVSYVTSPFILTRYERDLKLAGVSPPKLPDSPANDTANVTGASVNLIDGKLVLEDLDLQANKEESLDPWAKRIARIVHPNDDDNDAEARKDFTCRFALLPDEVMSFLAETATEIRTRIAIDPNTGTVRKGALWNEENLPAEAVLWGIFALSEFNNQKADDTFKKADDTFNAALPNPDAPLQLGGNAGVGSGLVRFLKEA